MNGFPQLQFAQMPLIQPRSEMQGFSDSLLQAGQMRQQRLAEEQKRNDILRQREFENQLAIQRMGIEQEQLGMQKEEAARNLERFGWEQVEWQRAKNLQKALSEAAPAIQAETDPTKRLSIIRDVAGPHLSPDQYVDLVTKEIENMHIARQEKRQEERDAFSDQIQLRTLKLKEAELSIAKAQAAASASRASAQSQMDMMKMLGDSYDRNYKIWEVQRKDYQDSYDKLNQLKKARNMVAPDVILNQDFTAGLDPELTKAVTIMKAMSTRKPLSTKDAEIIQADLDRQINTMEKDLYHNWTALSQFENSLNKMGIGQPVHTPPTDFMQKFRVTPGDYMGIMAGGIKDFTGSMKTALKEIFETNTFNALAKVRKHAGMDKNSTPPAGSTPPASYPISGYPADIYSAATDTFSSGYPRPKK